MCEPSAVAERLTDLGDAFLQLEQLTEAETCAREAISLVVSSGWQGLELVMPYATVAEVLVLRGAPETLKHFWRMPSNAPSGRTTAWRAHSFCAREHCWNLGAVTAQQPCRRWGRALPKLGGRVRLFNSDVPWQYCRTRRGLRGTPACARQLMRSAPL